METHLICRAIFEYKDNIDLDKVTAMRDFRDMEAYSSHLEAWKAMSWHSKNDSDGEDYTYFIISRHATYDSLDEYIEFCKRLDEENEVE